MKMLMEIDPLPMRGSLVMTMVMISPTRREVSLAEQLRQSPRLVPSRDGGASSRKLPYESFQGKRHHILEDGHRGASKWPTRQGARPPPSWNVDGPPLVLSLPNIFNMFQNWSFRTFGVVQNRSLIFAPFPAQNPVAGILPLHVNLVK